MAASSFIQRKIDVKLALDGDTFNGSNDTLQVSGLRCQASIESYSGSIGSFASQLQMRISGMKQSDMAKLSTLGFSTGTYKKNLITVSAGDDKNGMSEVFSGGIIYGNTDYNAMPDVGMEIVASALANIQYPSIAGNSWKGPVNVAGMLAALAQSAGLQFKNAGVTAVLTNHSCGGTALDQIKDICTAANVIYSIDGGTLYAWPADGNRDNTVIDLSPQTGMVGYPSYIVNGIEVVSIFNPVFAVGGQVKVTSSTPPPAKNAPQPGGVPAIGANGTFYIWEVTHDIASQDPNGPWFTRLKLGTSKYNAH